MELIILIINIFIIISIFVHLFRRKNINKLVNRTIGIIDSLGYTISLNGLPGCGKTTTASGITHLLTQKLMIEISNRLDENKIKLKEINFNELDIYILTVINNFKFLKSEIELIDFIFKNYIEYNKIRFDSYYTDYLSIESKYKLLFEYIWYFYILNIRGIAIYSNGYFFNKITCKNSYILDTFDLMLKFQSTYNEFRIYPGSIIIGDESNIFNSSAFSNSKILKLMGDGDFKSLIRNGGRGLVYHLSLKQDFEDEQKKLRKLTDSNLMIIDRNDDILNFKLFRSLLKFILSCINFAYLFFVFLKHPLKFKRNKSLMLNNGILKKINYQFFQFDKYLKSFGFLNVKVFRYYIAEDYGKMDQSLFDRMSLYFPIRYCYGSTETYQYSALFDYLLRNSKSNLDYTSKKGKFVVENFINAGFKEEKLRKIYNERR